MAFDLFPSDPNSKGWIKVWEGPQHCGKALRGSGNIGPVGSWLSSMLLTQRRLESVLLSLRVGDRSSESHVRVIVLPESQELCSSPDRATTRFQSRVTGQVSLLVTFIEIQCFLQGNKDGDQIRGIFKAWREKMKEGQRQPHEERERERGKRGKKREDEMKLDKGMERGRNHI